MLRKKHEGPASLFCRKAEVLFGALKTKSCLSDSEFFLFSAEKYRSRQKSADGEFFRTSPQQLVFASFLCSGKEMKSLRGLSESKAFKPLRRLSKKPSGN